MSEHETPLIDDDITTEQIEAEVTPEPETKAPVKKASVGEVREGEVRFRVPEGRRAFTFVGPHTRIRYRMQPGEQVILSRRDAAPLFEAHWEEV